MSVKMPKRTAITRARTNDPDILKKNRAVVSNLKRLRASLDAANKTLQHIATLRDELRNHVDDIDAILESLDQGTEDWDYGMRHLTAAVDKFSEYL